MDLSKALAMMGFGTARIVDQSGERNALDSLNTALTRQMENFDKKKKKITDTEKVEKRRETQQDKLRDEIRTMHEAYQFLAKKYSSDKARLEEKKQLQSSDILDEGIEKEEEDQADEVFGMETVTAVKSAVVSFKDANVLKTETEDNNNSARTIRSPLEPDYIRTDRSISDIYPVEQSVNNTQNIT